MVTFFEQEVANKQDKHGKIKGYVKKLTEYDFVASIHMMMDVMPNIMELTLVFQKRDLDCSIIAPAVQACITELTKYRNDELSPTRKPSFKSLLKTLDHKGRLNNQNDQENYVSKVTNWLLGVDVHQESFQTIMHNFFGFCAGQSKHQIPTRFQEYHQCLWNS